MEADICLSSDIKGGAWRCSGLRCRRSPSAAPIRNGKGFRFVCLEDSFCFFLGLKSVYVDGSIRLEKVNPPTLIGLQGCPWIQRELGGGQEELA